MRSPGSFRVSDAVTTRVGEWHLQRFYFSYFSVTTLTSLGYADITPTGTLVLWLSWIEVLFGQIYVAVVVAQLVGLRLVQSLKAHGGEHVALRPDEMCACAIPAHKSALSDTHGGASSLTAHAPGLMV